MAALSIKMIGLDGCRGWLNTLVFAGRMAAGPGEAWHLAKSVDMSSFFHLLLFNASPLTAIVVAAGGIIAFTVLARAWWRAWPAVVLGLTAIVAPGRVNAL